jgi:hypothetical protein
LITDAPCHGTAFHNLRDDSYPEGDPFGLDIEKQVESLGEMKISFNAVKITNDTDKMY